MTVKRSTPGSIVAAVPGPFEAVVFDNDGLLLDTEDAWTRAERHLFRRYGAEFTMGHKRALLGTSVTESALKLEAMLAAPGEGAHLMEQLHELVMEEVLGGVPIRPGGRELVERLRADGVPVGLATNSSRPFVERVLVSSGFRSDEFGIVVSADDVERPKPAPDIYLAACAGLGAEPGRSAALEDSPPGVVAALAAGMFVIAVPYFPDQALDGASLTAPSLADPSVAAALGLTP
jgi:HAD superfamily hydrolase (TIGR01509 family)